MRDFHIPGFAYCNAPSGPNPRKCRYIASHDGPHSWEDEGAPTTTVRVDNDGMIEHTLYIGLPPGTYRLCREE